MKGKSTKDATPLEKFNCFVVAIVKVQRVLARSGEEASKLAVAKVRKVLSKEDGDVYIPGVTVIKGGMSKQVLQDIYDGKLPGLEGVIPKRKIKAIGEKDPKCRNCGHVETLHIEGGISCRGSSAIVCGCPGFEAVIDGIDEEITPNQERHPQEIENERRQERRKEVKEGKRKIEWGREVREIGDREEKNVGENGEKSDDSDASNVDTAADSGVGSTADTDTESIVSTTSPTPETATRCKEYWDVLPTWSDHSWDTGGADGGGGGRCIKCGETVRGYNERWSEHIKRMKLL